VQRRGDDLRIRIGDAKRTVSGQQEYWIRYRVKRGILYFEDHDELYWNVTGTAWPVPIDAVAARVGLPEELAPEHIQLACFTGRRGAIEQACRFHTAPGEVTFRTRRPLGVAEGLRHHERLMMEKLFPASPERVRRRWRVLGILVLAVAINLFVFVGAGLQHSIPVGLCGVLFLAFAGAMPRRTRKGRAAYEAILGFKEFMERVDRDRLERSGGRDAGHFERILPYAVVLGVADRWADAFADLYTEPPSWYAGRNVGHFRPQRFVSDLGRSLHSLGQAMRTQPQGGSGSSGLGGGGFSGGGFGGGGGGSW